MENIYYSMPKRYDTKEGKMLFGKVEYRDPVTTNLLDVYKYSKTNGDYIITGNPQYTDVYGIIDDCFTLNHLTLVCLYSYIGNMSDMSVDDADPNHWVHEYDYYVSFNNEKEENKTVVIGISNLRDTDVTLGSVNVVGYHNEFDCQNRTYVWDANCVLADDGGYVIQSNNTVQGRWILVWNQEALPSEIYGVTSNNYTNLNNLLSYLDYVGSTSIPTAKVIEFTNFRFPAKTNRKLSTNKIVRASRDCYFGEGNFEVQDIYIDGQDEAYNKTLGNFVIRDDNNMTKVCISWFSTADQFFNSNARTLIYDRDGGAASNWNKLNNSTYLSHCRLEYLVDTHTNFVADITFDNVELIMPNDFWWGETNTSKITLKNMKVDTRNFRKLKVSQCENCWINVLSQDGLMYDIQEKSSNHIHAHKGGIVQYEYSLESNLDLDWIDSYEDGSINGSLKYHGIASPKVLTYQSNFGNGDFEDVDVIDLNGYDNSVFALNMVQGSRKNFTVVNMNDIKFRFITDNAEDDYHLTIKDSKFTTNNWTKRMAAKTHIELINCEWTVETYENEANKVQNWGKSFRAVNTVINDNRIEVLNEYEEYSIEDTVVGDFELIDSKLHCTHPGYFKVSGDLILDNVRYSTASSNPEHTNYLGGMHGSSNVTITGSRLNKCYVYALGDAKTSYDFIFTGNTVTGAYIGFSYNKDPDDTSKILSDKYLNKAVIVGNTFPSHGNIILHNDATPSKYTIDNNTGVTKTTNPYLYTYRGLGGKMICENTLTSLKKNKSNGIWIYDHVHEDTSGTSTINTDVTGCADKLYSWLYQNSWFIPSKDSSKSYSEMIDLIKSRGFLHIEEIKEPVQGGVEKNGNQNNYFAVGVHILVTKKQSF